MHTAYNPIEFFSLPISREVFLFDYFLYSRLSLPTVERYLQTNRVSSEDEAVTKEA